MIVEEKLRKGEGFVARRGNGLGLKLRQVAIVDWNPEWLVLYFDTDDMADSHPEKKKLEDAAYAALGIDRPRAPGRPPNPPKEAA